jgi:hypothetical protein
LFIGVCVAFEAIGYFGMWINSRSSDHLANRNYLSIRAMLMGDAEQLPRYLSQPYLGYIPYPGFKSHGVTQHNQDGYRGARVPLSKTNKYRVLCLGGSTTYGFGVDSPEQTFPAQLELILNKYIRENPDLNQEYNGAEVMNAGIEAGNSAEILQQYLFKYRYYKPDAIVLHMGINDALLENEAPADFQLDYTHYRRMSFNLSPLSRPAVWLLHSYFFSYLTIRLFYNDFGNSSYSFKKDKNQIFCKWSDAKDRGKLSGDYSYYPFYKNTRAIFREIIGDSVRLFVFPEVLNERSEFVKANKKYLDYSNLNRDLQSELSKQPNVIFVPMSFDSIHESWWLDDCHVNKAGERYKAQLLSRCIGSALAR